MSIPAEWTFRSDEVATNFDAHVREQLPWYDLATRAVVHIGRHYIPDGGLVYDVGASTGNIGRALAEVLSARCARLVAIEESEEMARAYRGGGELVVASALDYDFEMYDFCVCFLSVMFFDVVRRRSWLNKMRSNIRPGGALVIVDKIETPTGYVGTVLRRLAMAWKIESGASADDILRKELSLAGYQRPLTERIVAPAEEFFRFGEFVGWVIERPEF